MLKTLQRKRLPKGSRSALRDKLFAVLSAVQQKASKMIPLFKLIAIQNLFLLFYYLKFNQLQYKIQIKFPQVLFVEGFISIYNDG